MLHKREKMGPPYQYKKHKTFPVITCPRRTLQENGTNLQGIKFTSIRCKLSKNSWKSKTKGTNKTNRASDRSTSEFSKPKKTDKEGVPQTIIYEFKSPRTQISKNPSTIIDNSTTKNQNLPSCIEILKADHEWEETQAHGAQRLTFNRANEGEKLWPPSTERAKRRGTEREREEGISETAMKRDRKMGRSD